MTVRAILLGLLCVVVQSAVIPYNEAVVRGTSLTGNHLPACSMIALLVLVLVVNPLWHRLRPGRELQPSELAVVWIMGTVSANVPFRGFVGFLVPLIATPRYYATPENHWDQVLLPCFRPGTVLPTKASATLFYEGNWGRPIDAGLWARPLLYWSLFALCLWLATLGLAVLFRRQWAEHEKFAFPLLQAPLELIAPHGHGPAAGRTLRQPLLWWGAALPLAVHLLNGLHAQFPFVPQIPLQFPVFELFTQRPWSAMRWWPQLTVSLYFAVVGVAYLIPLEISLSFWFFFLWFKLQYVWFAAQGAPMNPWIAASRQALGAQWVIAGYMVWTARRHLAAVARRVLGQGGASDDDEPLPYRAAFLAAVLGLVGCGGLAVHAGADLWVTAGVLALWVAITFCLTWMVIAGGMYLVQAPFYPSDILVMVWGSRRVGTRNLVALRVPERALMRDWGEILMPHLLHGFHLDDVAGLSRRATVPIMALSLVACLAVAVPVTVWTGHAVGGTNSLYGHPGLTVSVFQPLVIWEQKPLPPQPAEVRQAVLGAVFTLGLLLLRARSYGFALHPIGFAVGASYANYHLWSSLLLGWLLKSVVLRWGGLVTFRRLRPFFLGLIVGDYLAAAVWVTVGLFTGTGYRLLPVP